MIDDESKESAEHEDAEVVTEARKRWKLSIDNDSVNRQNYKEEVRFYNGENYYPPHIKLQREENKEPCVVVNKGRAMVRTVTNSFRQNPVAAKVRPVDQGSDTETAEIFTGIIRHIEDQSSAISVYENALFCATTGGFGYARVVTDYAGDTFDQDIYIEPIYNPLTVVRDYKALNLDGSDSRYYFITERINKEDAKKLYPDADIGTWDAVADSDWVDDDDVTIAEYWYFEEEEETLYLLPDKVVVTKTEYDKMANKPEILDQRPIKQDKVKWCKLAGNCTTPIEKKDWAGKYLPIVPFYGDTTVIDGKLVTQSLLYHAKDALRMLSWFRSTEIQLLALTPKAPMVGTQEQFEGHPEWDDANQTNYSKLTYTHVQGVPPPQRQGFDSPPSGVLQGALNSQQDMQDILNIHEASLGQEGNETSGRAIVARQKQGDTSTYHFPDNASKAVNRIAKILVDLIPKIYDTPRVVRILGEDGSEKMTPVNQKFTDKDKNNQEIERIYNLGVGTYDVVTSAGPSFQTRRQEESEVLQTMLQGNPALMQTHGDIIAETLDFPGSEKFAARTRKMIPKELLDVEEGDEPQLPPEVMQQMQEMQAQIDQMNQAGQALHQELIAAQSKQQLEQAKIEVDRFNAETNRMKAEADIQAKLGATPQGVADTLTEAEKIQHDTELQIRLVEMKEDHEKEMAILNARLDRMKSNPSAMVDIDENGDEIESEHSLAIGSLQAQLAQQSQDFSDTLNNTIAALKQPEEIVRDENGVIVGAKTALGFKKIIRDENGNPIGVETV